MQFWQGFIGLSLLAALFVIWPTIAVRRKYKKELRSATGSDDALKEVYSQHVEDLENTLSRGEIGDKEFKKLKQDLEKTLAVESTQTIQGREAPIVSSFKSRLPVISLILIIPLATYAMYDQIGAKADWEIYDLMVKPVTNVDQARERADLLVEKLQVRLEDKPDNTSNWYLLASTSMDMGRYDEAVMAYRKVLEKSPNAPRIMAELAQALFSRSGNTVTPEVRDYTQRALKIAPMMPTALGIAGVDAYQSGDYSKAITYWQNAISQLDPKSAAYQVLSSGVEKAKAALKQTGGQVAATEEVAEPSDKPSITVSVALSPNVVADSSDTVFVYARAWKGPKMPLAIERMKVSDLPVTVTLSESMMPGMDLSSFPQVEVIARVSPSGSPVPSAGDWQAAVGPVIVSSQDGPVSLSIDTQVE